MHTPVHAVGGAAHAPMQVISFSGAVHLPSPQQLLSCLALQGTTPAWTAAAPSRFDPSEAGVRSTATRTAQVISGGRVPRRTKMSHAPPKVFGKQGRDPAAAGHFRFGRVDGLTLRLSLFQCFSRSYGCICRQDGGRAWQPLCKAAIEAWKCFEQHWLRHSEHGGELVGDGRISQRAVLRYLVVGRCHPAGRRGRSFSTLVHFGAVVADAPSPLSTPRSAAWPNPGGHQERAPPAAASPSLGRRRR